MPNICCDTVVFYMDDEATDATALRQLAEDLETCYSSPQSVLDCGMGILFEYLHIPAYNLYLRGDYTCMTVQEDHICLDVSAAWKPLFKAYQKLAEHYGLQFVMQSEEPGCNIFVNTDVYGRYLDTRFRILLYLEEDASGTIYEKLWKGQTDTEFYFSSEEDLCAWFAGYGVLAQNLNDLTMMLDRDYILLTVYDLTYE